MRGLQQAGTRCPRPPVDRWNALTASVGAGDHAQRRGRCPRPGTGPGAGVASKPLPADAAHRRAWRPAEAPASAARGRPRGAARPRREARRPGRGRRTRRRCGRSSPRAARPTIHSRARAYSTAKRAGCVKCVCRSRSARRRPAGDRAPRAGRCPSPASASAQRSTPPRKTGLAVVGLAAHVRRTARPGRGTGTPRRHARRRLRVTTAARGRRLEGRRRRRVRADHGPAVAEGLPARLEGVGHVGQVSASGWASRWSARRWRGRSSAVAVRAESTSSCGAAARCWRRDARRLLEHDVGVGAADAERADAGPPRRRPRGQPRSGVLTKKGLRREVDLRVGRARNAGRRRIARGAATARS